MTYRLPIFEIILDSKSSQSKGFIFVEVNTADTSLPPHLVFIAIKMYGEVACATHCSGFWDTQRTKMPL